MKRQALIGVVAAALFAFAGISFAQAPAQAGGQDQTTTAPAHKKATKHMTKHKKTAKKHKTKAASAGTHKGI